MNIDCRNLGCPEPVIRAKKALDEITEGVLTVLVNSASSLENVQRFAKNQGFETRAEPKGDHHAITIVKGFACEVASAPASSGRVLFIKHDGVGEGELGLKLMNGFMAALVEQPVLPEKLFFVNRGVYCTTAEGPVLESLKKLEAKGVQIFSCGACLEFFKLSDQLKVGQSGNAYDTLHSLINSANLISL